MLLENTLCMNKVECLNLSSTIDQHFYNICHFIIQVQGVDKVHVSIYNGIADRLSDLIF